MKETNTSTDSKAEWRKQMKRLSGMDTEEIIKTQLKGFEGIMDCQVYTSA